MEGCTKKLLELIGQNQKLTSNDVILRNRIPSVDIIQKNSQSTICEDVDPRNFSDKKANYSNVNTTDKNKKSTNLNDIKQDFLENTVNYSTCSYPENTTCIDDKDHCLDEASISTSL